MEDSKIIHLYILNRCTHHCPLCCNKEYNIYEIPVVTVEELRNAEILCLTGGEPFLFDGICDFANDIKRQYPNIKQIYVYTCGDSLHRWLSKHNKLHDIDGVNISPKNKRDCEHIQAIFNHIYWKTNIADLSSSRIYLFPNVRERMKSLSEQLASYENIQIINREWQTKFKAASGIFRRLPILF